MRKDEREQRLSELLQVRRTEAFWAAQQARITAAAARPAPPRRWLLMPAAALSAALLLVLARDLRRQPEPQPAVTAAFIEHLDLLDDMDVLEAVPEEEL